LERVTRDIPEDPAYAGIAGTIGSRHIGSDQNIQLAVKQQRLDISFLKLRPHIRGDSISGIFRRGCNPESSEGWTS
jgi:hypothetical protein